MTRRNRMKKLAGLVRQSNNEWFAYVNDDDSLNHRKLMKKIEKRYFKNYNQLKALRGRK